MISLLWKSCHSIQLLAYISSRSISQSNVFNKFSAFNFLTLFNNDLYNFYKFVIQERWNVKFFSLVFLLFGLSCFLPY